MVDLIKKWGLVVLIVLTTLLFHTPLLTSLRLPIPADTIVGLYHPYRDLYAATNPNGLPFKNPLITDPVRQTFIWKELSIDLFSRGELPLWNPYEMSGKPLMANIQSGVFYPLNIIFVLKPFYLSWSLFIYFEMLLGSLFMYLYLKSLKVNTQAIYLGVVAWVLSGFFIAWMEWGNVLHVAIWLPLILLAKDKIVEKVDRKWLAILIVSEVCAFLAGHLQTWFYLVVFVNVYLLLNLTRAKHAKKSIVAFAIAAILIIVICLIQVLPSIQYILLSNRALDQLWTQDGWFIPLGQLVQFVVPDFFGNPATLNYYGVWNYAEFIGYIGIVPFVFALYAALFRRDKKTTFFLVGLILALLLVTRNPLSEIPFRLNIPFIATAQPTRLLFIIDFILAVLAVLGLQRYSEQPKKIFVPLVIVGMFVTSLWVFAVFGGHIFLGQENAKVAISNLKLPTLVLLISSTLLIIHSSIKHKKARTLLIWSILLISSLDLIRFGWKFNPFTQEKYLFPQTQTINFLKKQQGIFRVSSLDSRIMPPNFFTHYKISSIEGYDPLYLTNYAQYITIMEREKPDIDGPYGFNRIITPHNYKSQLYDFLNARYVLSLDDMDSPKLEKVAEEGKTKVYLNKSAMNRAFFVSRVISTKDVPTELFNANLLTEAVVSGDNKETEFSVGTAEISKYSENEVVIDTKNSGDGFLVISDVYYPTWEVLIDGKKGSIQEVNLAFRGVYIPKGNHVVLFKNRLF